MEIVSIFFFYNKKKLFHNRGLYRANRIVERTDKESNGSAGYIHKVPEYTT